MSTEIALGKELR